MSHIRRRILGSVAAAILLTLASFAPAYADLGDCVAPVLSNSAHQGAFESDVPSTTRGIVARVMVRTPDLCDTPPDIYPTGSGMYIMLTNYAYIAQTGENVWWQIGYRKQGDGCAHWFMQYNPASGPLVDRESAICATSGSWFTLVMRHTPYQGSYAWQSYVLTSDNCCYVWSAPNDPTSLDFPPADGEFSSEAHNSHDQSGGSNNYPAYLDDAYWWDSGYSIHYTNWQTSEKFCQLCDDPPTGPYNVSYPDSSTIRVWTDGF